MEDSQQETDKTEKMSTETSQLWIDKTEEQTPRSPVKTIHGSSFQYDDILPRERPLVAGLGQTLVFLLTCVFCALNIALLNLGSPHRDSDHFGNGDRIVPCPEKRSDQSCFEVRDHLGELIYRNERDRKLLGFFRCSDEAYQTSRHRCMGEYSFSHNSSLIWYHRLYFDLERKKKSMISGMRDTDHVGKTLKYRHMLDPPYNYIISTDEIPADLHPDHQISFKGKSCINLS